MKIPSKSKTAPVTSGILLPPKNPRNIRTQVAMRKITIGEDGGSIERNQSISPVSVNSESADYVEPIKQIKTKPIFIDAPKSREVPCYYYYA